MARSHYTHAARSNVITQIPRSEAREHQHVAKYPAPPSAHSPAIHIER